MSIFNLLMDNADSLMSNLDVIFLVGGKYDPMGSTPAPREMTAAEKAAEAERERIAKELSDKTNAKAIAEAAAMEAEKQRKLME